MRAYADAGHFRAGSMGPKVAACLRFAAEGGVAVIGSLAEAAQLVAGTSGTRIVPDDGDALTGRRAHRGSPRRRKRERRPLLRPPRAGHQTVRTLEIRSSERQAGGGGS
jgi:hypothetical protein